MKKRVRFSKRKGASYELQIANWFEEHFHCEARRAQQYCGLGGDADISINLPIHLECKAVESFSLYSALSQAKKDASKTRRTPVVIHKKNNKPSVLIVELDNLTKLISDLFSKIRKEC